jgi:hypothetical protein
MTLKMERYIPPKRRLTLCGLHRAMLQNTELSLRSPSNRSLVTVLQEPEGREFASLCRSIFPVDLILPPAL